MIRQVFITILLALSSHIAANDQLWDFRIELSKEEYLVGENIWFDVIMTNISPDTLKSAATISFRGQGFKFIIKDSLGNQIDYTGYYSPALLNPRAYLITPGQQVYSCFRLNTEGGECDYQQLRNNPGKYTIQGFVELPFENDCYFDGLTSNQLAFRISEPEGEEKTAYEILNSAEKRSTADSLGEQLYRRLLNEFPNSVYAEAAFFLIDYNFKTNYDHDNYVEYANATLFRYPNSGYTNALLGRIWRQAEWQGVDSTEFDITLSNITRVAHGTRLARFAERQLFMRHRVKSPDPCPSIIDTVPKWELKIEMPKTAYRLKERISVDVTLTNISPDTVANDCDLFLESSRFGFEIIDSSGKRLEYKGLAGSRTPNTTTYLFAPGEEIKMSYLLSSTYGHGIESEYRLGQFPGQFSVRAKTVVPAAAEYDPYSFPPLTSNKLLFIIEKSDRLDAEAGLWNPEHIPSFRTKKPVFKKYH